MSEKKRVLFICMGNDVRSPMAEALLRDMDSEHFEAFSAGIAPCGIDPRTSQALEHAGVSAAGLRSKSIEEFSGQHFDYLIDLCDKANHEEQRLPRSEEALLWNFANPATSERPEAFRQTLQEIHERLMMFDMVKNRG